MTLSSVVFRNMSSEPRPQPAPGSRSRRRPADPAGSAGAAERGRALGYDPDDPASWPSDGQPPVTGAVRTAEAAEAAEAAANSGAAPDAAPAAARSPAESRQLTDPIVMRALAHPVRTALIELLSVLDTVTATQASELLGESPANCAFHLRTLAKYGFAVEAGGGRGRERPWKAADLNISVSSQQSDPQAAMAADALTRLWFDQWVERARQMFGSNATLPGWEHATGWSRRAAFLTPEETRDLILRIRALIREYEPRKDDPSLRPPGALPVEWSIFYAPVAELAGVAEAQARAAAERRANQGVADQAQADPRQPDSE
jgi:hypothetical protein